MKKIALFGDSHAVEWQGNEITSPCNWRSYGAFHRANAMLGHPLLVSAVKAFSGETSAQLLSRYYTEIVPIITDIDALFVTTGTNDPGIISAQQSIDSIAAMYQNARGYGLGRLFMFSAVNPRNGLGQSKVAHYTAINDWARQFERENTGFVFIDSAASYLDTSSMAKSTAYDAIDSYLRDGTHDNAVGAGIRAAVIYDKLLPIVGTGKGSFGCNRLGSDGDLLCFSNNPLMIEGAGGTAGTGASGVVPEGWTLSRSVGSSITAAGSYVNGVYTLAIANAVDETEKISLRQDIASSTRVPFPGRRYFGEGWFGTGSGTGTFAHLQVTAQVFGSTGFAASANAYDGVGGYMAMTNPAGVYRTRPFIAPLGVTSVRTELQISTSGSASLSLPIKSLGQREVVT